jgi:hypothetical protein
VSNCHRMLSSTGLRRRSAATFPPSGCAVLRQLSTVESVHILWTIDDIASYYRRSLRQARRIVSDDGFPPPVRGDRGRWVAEQVQIYAAGGWVEPALADDVLRPTVAQGQRITRRKAA